MVSFAIQGGSLILKDGKLLIGDPSCCCCCKRVYHVDCVLGGANPGDIIAETTVTIPNNFNLPAKVQIVGTVDDVLLKDNQPWPPGRTLNDVAYAFDHTWLENNRSFIIAARDTAGGSIGLLNVYIYITCENGNFSLATDCDSQNPIELYTVECPANTTTEMPYNPGTCWFNGDSECVPVDSPGVCSNLGGRYCQGGLGTSCLDDPC